MHAGQRLPQFGDRLASQIGANGKTAQGSGEGSGFIPCGVGRPRQGESSQKIVNGCERRDQRNGRRGLEYGPSAALPLLRNLFPVDNITVNLALIGYRGTGKTTVAALVARRLGWNWVDLDVELERAAGQSIAEIFAASGEAAFRASETQTLQRYAAQDRTVLATGGGVVLKPRNRELLAGMTAVVWLQAPADVLWQRIQADTATQARRPNLTSGGGLTEVEQLLASREPLYRQCATLEVDTEERSPEELAAEIIARLSLEDNG